MKSITKDDDNILTTFSYAHSATDNNESEKRVDAKWLRNKAVASVSSTETERRRLIGQLEERLAGNEFQISGVQ